MAEEATDALTQEEAIDAARAVAIVEDDNVLVRYLNQGIPPRGTWIVSFYTGPSRHPITAQTVMVDAADRQKSSTTAASDHVAVAHIGVPNSGSG